MSSSTTTTVTHPDGTSIATTTTSGIKGFDVSGRLIHGLIPALITPFYSAEKGGGVNTEVVPALVEHFLACGVDGFYVCGNTGEGFSCTLDERKTMAEAAVKAVAGRVPVLVHVGHSSTEDACTLAAHAKTIGADCTSSVVPGDLPGDDLAKALELTAAHFDAIGKAGIDLPFYIYWYAGTAAVNGVTAEQYLAAMEGVTNLAGCKYTSKDFYLMGRMLELRPDLNILSGCDEMNLSAKVIGAHGAIGSTYHVHPKIYVAMQKAFDAGDLLEAKRLQYLANGSISELINLCDCNSRGTNIIAGLKAVLRSRGFDVGHPRETSSTPLSAAAEAQLLKYCADNNIE